MTGRMAPFLLFPSRPVQAKRKPFVQFFRLFEYRPQTKSAYLCSIENFFSSWSFLAIKHHLSPFDSLMEKYIPRMSYHLLRLLTAAAAAVILTGCDLIDYHPYDTRVHGAHDINRRNAARIEEQCAGRDSVRFAVISDTQRWYDETNDCVRAINARGDVDFVIHCGDLSDFGVTREFELQRDILEKLHMPYVVLLGNHDCLGTGADVYRYLFGSPNFSFNAGNLHVLCLNTNAFEYDYSIAVPDFAFIRADRDSLPASVTRTVVAMHAQPLSDQFNNNVAQLFEDEIRRYPSLAFCLCGHEHRMAANDWFNDGTIYYECACAKLRGYLLFTLHANGTYSYEEIYY